jgi:histidyl-tRNA synthetase
MPSPQGALPGFRDFYPSELAERAYIMRVWREVARRYAFVEYDGPPLEPLELFTRKSGEEIVGQLYNFEDKGSRAVALRPEMTPTFARMVAARANALRKPVRWFSVPQLFRYERQQRGRLREHFQLNVDLVGEADVTADAELLSVAIEIMRAFGFTHEDVRARVSDRRLLRALALGAGVTEAQLPTVFAAVDKFEREPRESLERKLGEAGVAPESVKALFDLIRPIPRQLLPELAKIPGVAEHAERLERYFAYLDALGVSDWVSLDLTIVRGLAYYTGIVFELFDAKGELRAICGGGRYNTLLESLGGVDLPALGFGMGDVVLRELLVARGKMPVLDSGVDYWVAPDAPEVVPVAMGVATLLRRLGHRVEYPLREQALGRQLKTAAGAGAKVVVLLKKDALQADGSATIKSLSDGGERTVPLKEWLDEMVNAARAEGSGPA